MNRRPQVDVLGHALERGRCGGGHRGARNRRKQSPAEHFRAVGARLALCVSSFSHNLSSPGARTWVPRDDLQAVRESSDV